MGYEAAYAERLRNPVLFWGGISGAVLWVGLNSGFSNADAVMGAGGLSVDDLAVFVLVGCEVLGVLVHGAQTHAHG